MTSVHNETETATPDIAPVSPRFQTLRSSVVSRMMSLPAVVIVSFIVLQSFATAEFREWTDVKGRKVSANYRGMQNGKVSLELKNGRVLPFSLNSLSKADQQWVEQASATSSETKAGSNPDPKTPFEVHPKMDILLDVYCYSCHDEDKQKGDIRLDQLGTLSHRSRLELLNKMQEQLFFAEMPPRKKKSQPTDPERKQMVEWITSELDKFDASNLEDKMRYPDYGNYVDHDKLFSGKIKDSPYTPSRRWLVSPQIFHQRVADVFKLPAKGRPRSFYGVTNPFILPDHAGVRYYDHSALDGGHLLMMLTNAEWISKKQIRAGRVKNGEIKAGDFENRSDKWLPGKTPAAFEDIILKKSKPTGKEMIAAIHAQFDCVLQRQASDSELKRYLPLLESTIEIGGNTEGLRQMLISVLLESEFLYRYEFGAGSVDNHGRKKLSPREASYAIAYAVSDRGPDETLVKAAQEGKLTTKADFQREVTRLLNDKQAFFAEGAPTLSGKNLRSHKVSHPKLNRFFREFFGYANSVKVFKDTPRSGGFYSNTGRGSSGTAGRVTNEADRIVDYILKEDKNVFEQLLTTEKNFVYHPHNNEAGTKLVDGWREVYETLKDTNWREQPYEVAKKHEELVWKHLRVKPAKKNKGAKRHDATLGRYMEYFENTFGKGNTPFTALHWAHGFNFRYAEIYNLPPAAGTRGGYSDKETWDYPVVQPFKMPNRKGILTHPAWLVANSQNSATDPVHRGKWVREKLLAGRVPDVPITVDAQIPEDHHKTLRERLDSVTTKKECWKCHEHMNPLGLPFEAFDDFGRFRTEEELEHPDNLLTKGNGKNNANTYKTRPVNPRGHLKGTGNPKLDGDVKDVFDMIERLAKSERVRQSIIRHAFRYFMGRNETLADSKTLIDADDAYVSSEGSFQAVIISLLTSDSFIYRK